MTQQDIINTINPIAQKQGIPSRLWQAIVSVESGFNPNVIGDNGTSFGLFQLHIGSQAPSGVPTSDLLNPVTNATYALPAIGNSWNSLKSSFDDSVSWWSKFAGMSGHPGYGSNTQSVAVSLKSAYDANLQVPSNSTASNSTLAYGGATSVGDWLSNIGLSILFFIIAIVIAIVAIIILR